MLTVGSVEATTGVMDYYPDEAETARAMIRMAASVTVPADSTGFGKLALFTAAGFESIDCHGPRRRAGRADGRTAALMIRKRVEIIC